MVRKLKTYETSIGFFDLAIAAPSMKAALEAWGADSNLFHQGAAKQSDDPDVVAATLKKPGVVLKRPVGSNKAFGESADLPTDLAPFAKPRKGPPKARVGRPASGDDRATERRAAQASEKEQKRRDRERAKAEAARERTQAAVDKAQAALEKAEREHHDRTKALRSDLDALEKKLRKEDDQWDKDRSQLQAAVRRAREQ
jgi:hypothetical protein